ncbi:MAG: patatin-like phospholipase family protein [Candidatus Zophobacter franzmannii]|nr:patatin-like phospholipase family protein [Candidatus Zophobacter franzmannii]
MCSALEGQHKIGIALSGGGARGYAHIGVLKVIDELDLEIDYIAGTSIGSLIGALYASGYSAAQIEQLALNGKLNFSVERQTARDDVHIMRKHWAPYGNLRVPLDKNFLPSIPSGLTYGQKMQMQLFDLFFPGNEYESFDSLPIPYRCVTTDFSAGTTTIFASGSLHEACRASMNTPSIMEPYFYKGKYYVDGGLLQNLPSKTVKEMGADFVIGIKANSPLRPNPAENNFVQNFDQALNIAITENVKNSINDCSMLIEPQLDQYTNLDFNRIAEIILIGEQEARKHLKLLQKIKLTQQSNPKSIRPSISHPDFIRFDKIDVIGNVGFTRLQIREFLQLIPGISYNKEQITEAFGKTYNSGLFEYIYPTIITNERTILRVNLKEKTQKHISLNLSYNDDENLSAGVIFDFTNYLFRNSQLLFEIELGGRNEVQADFVKNYGRYSGLYFRLFPYYKESKYYTYDDKFMRTNSYLGQEFGGTAGIGFYVGQLFIAEAFAYHYNFELFRDISMEDISDKLSSAGVGFKFYQETLDDYSFPMTGSRFIFKYNYAQKEFLSDVDTRKVYSKLFFSDKISSRLSLNFSIEYGSYHEYTEASQYQDFYLGGSDSFPGFKFKQISAPIFKTFGLGLTWNIYKNFYLQNYAGAMNYAKSDIWDPWEDFTYGGSMILGYKNIFAPVKVGIGFNDQTGVSYFVNVGYNFDIFEFSHR